MVRVRLGLGLFAGVILILSSAAHSLLGGKQIDFELAKAQVPADLALGLKFGWYFGGVAMLTFGIIAIWHFVRRLRGMEGWAVPVIIIAAAYICFGAWALLASDFNLFFLIFLIPGSLLGWAVTARRLAGS